MTKRPSLHSSEAAERESQLRRELDEALREIERLEALRKKDGLRREFPNYTKIDNE